MWLPESQSASRRVATTTYCAPPQITLIGESLAVNHVYAWGVAPSPGLQVFARSDAFALVKDSFIDRCR